MENVIDNDRNILQFIEKANNASFPINSRIVKGRAKTIIGKPSAMSNGWLNKFKMRHCISNRIISGEEGSVNMDDISRSLSDSIDTFLKYPKYEIFNCD